MYKNIIQWIFEYIKNICENEPVIRLGTEKQGSLGNTSQAALLWCMEKTSYWIGSKSTAPCLHSGQMISSGSSSPS